MLFVFNLCCSLPWQTLQEIGSGITLWMILKCWIEFLCLKRLTLAYGRKYAQADSSCVSKVQENHQVVYCVL